MTNGVFVGGDTIDLMVDVNSFCVCAAVVDLMEYLN